MRPLNARAALTAPLALAGIITVPLMLAACGYQPSLGDYRPVVDSYNTDMAAYEVDRGQCVAVAMQAQAEYERQQRHKRESNLTIGLIVGAIAGAAVGSVTGDAGDGAVVGGTLGALEGGLAETDYDPVTSPRKIVDRCMKNRGYETLSDLGKGA
ncbi:MAG: glycine zipper domain-containing protein [Alphaproteobacteria bacterium]|nr:glycine zipper domain-containing protein [Alphaproteobacteria bacterium]